MSEPLSAIESRLHEEFAKAAACMVSRTVLLCFQVQKRGGRRCRPEGCRKSSPAMAVIRSCVKTLPFVEVARGVVNDAAIERPQAAIVVRNASEKPT